MELEGVPVTVDELSAIALINYGHFTSMRVEGSQVRGLDLHLERLARDSQAVFGVGVDTEKVRALARKLAVQVSVPVIMRVTIFDPELSLGHPAVGSEPRVLVTLRPVGPGGEPPIRLKSVPYQRELPEVKHIGLFGTVHQRRRVQRAGFDDVLFVDASGRVSEGATWNIGFLRNGRVSWPDANCLSGVTMRLASAAMERQGIEVHWEPITLSEISQADSAFITNAGVGLRPVAAIDGLLLSDGASFVDQLRKEYEATRWQPL